MEKVGGFNAAEGAYLTYILVGKSLNRQVAEMIARHLVIQGVLGEDAYFTGPYGSIAVKARVCGTSVASLLTLSSSGQKHVRWNRVSCDSWWLSMRMGRRKKGTGGRHQPREKERGRERKKRLKRKRRRKKRRQRTYLLIYKHQKLVTSYKGLASLRATVEDDAFVVMSALKEEGRLVGDDPPPLGRLQGAHEGLEGALRFLVVKDVLEGELPFALTPA